MNKENFLFSFLKLVRVNNYSEPIIWYFTFKQALCYKFKTLICRYNNSTRVSMKPEDQDLRAGLKTIY
ncbi:hypothetical protein LEP1GSC021_3497 [Leptospira noguchii str. 1993005606]|uniref:Uncharacterized protein n=1 Tax=Leptospira noguchii str. 2007001578 TaxID=1049974 RepID=A0ABP2TBR1_9LEPT|nr:hypothetical protein LEP1GSC035_4296 [Leptospira noguchii str. 2007001578]EPE84702.1 hypothetical protein LEP1GSC021_3497 [Leptospira noguchii str. 1993005606]